MIVPAAPTVAFPGVKLLHIPLIVRYLTKLVGASTSFIFLMSQKLSGLVTGTRQFSRVLPKLRRDCSLARPNEKIVMYHPSNRALTLRQRPVQQLQIELLGHTALTSEEFILDITA